MTVLLVLATFAIFILIDYYRTKQPALQLAVEHRPALPAPQREFPMVAAGFRVPAHLAYHPGHTWALKESSELVRVGMDDFAARLAGKLDHIQLPERGRWVRQGQGAVSLKRDGAKLQMTSPIEGTVVEINEAVLRDPDLARRDPYGEGWLMLVNAPDAKVSFRNLVSGSLARWWTEESASRLQRHMPATAGMLAQDGGFAIEDLGSSLPDAKWLELGREFFLV
jgi:glycine cleavage system H lipoate-binding protein